MATVFTHGFVGALGAYFVPNSIPRWRAAVVLAIAAILPDADVVAFTLGIPYEHPLGHRGFTHSIVFALALGAALASMFVSYVAPFSRDWLRLAGLIALATASHGVLDALTDAGLGVAFFWPWDNSRYFLPWRPLATSPIGIGAFFSGGWFAILASEFRWIWMPALVIVSSCAILARSIRRA